MSAPRSKRQMRALTLPPLCVRWLRRVPGRPSATSFLRLLGDPSPLWRPSAVHVRRHGGRI
eukprot:7207322-Alexandrium_andersonii.AAC.1